MSQTNAPVRLPGDCPGSQLPRRPWRFRFEAPLPAAGDLTVIVKVVPPPGVSETKMPPWWASMISLAGGVGTVKTVEQMRFFFVWDSGTVIHDTKGGKLFLLLHGKRNIAPFGTEAESIMKKNREHLPDAFRIALDGCCFFLRKPDGQAEAFFMGQWLKGFKGIQEQCVRLAFLRAQGEGMAVGAGQHEQIGNEA